MAWRQSGDKSFSGPMLTEFTDAYMGHQGEMSKVDKSFAVMLHKRVISFHYETLQLPESSRGLEMVDRWVSARKT